MKTFSSVCKSYKLHDICNTETKQHINFIQVEFCFVIFTLFVNFLQFQLNLYLTLLRPPTQRLVQFDSSLIKGFLAPACAWVYWNLSWSFAPSWMVPGRPHKSMNISSLIPGTIKHSCRNWEELVLDQKRAFFSHGFMVVQMGFSDKGCDWKVGMIFYIFFSIFNKFWHLKMTLFVEGISGKNKLRWISNLFCSNLISTILEKVAMILNRESKGSVNHPRASGNSRVRR